MTLARTLFASLSRNHGPKTENENGMTTVRRQLLLFVLLLLCIYNPSASYELYTLKYITDLSIKMVTTTFV